MSVYGRDSRSRSSTSASASAARGAVRGIAISSVANVAAQTPVIPGSVVTAAIVTQEPVIWGQPPFLVRSGCTSPRHRGGAESAETDGGRIIIMKGKNGRPTGRRATVAPGSADHGLIAVIMLPVLPPSTSWLSAARYASVVWLTEVIVRVALVFFALIFPVLRLH